MNLLEYPLLSFLHFDDENGIDPVSCKSNNAAASDENNNSEPPGGFYFCCLELCASFHEEYTAWIDERRKQAELERKVRARKKRQEELLRMKQEAALYGTNESCSFERVITEEAVNEKQQQLTDLKYSDGEFGILLRVRGRMFTTNT